MDFTGKKVLICGMGRSGKAAATVCAQLGANTTCVESTQVEDPIGFVHEYELVIISPGISVYAPFVAKAQELGIPVWGEAELAYRLCPCPMLAITGTNGKTTVTTLVGEIMSRANPQTVVAGNIGTPLTSLVGGLSENAMVVAEISSFQLETIQAFRPAISAVLNMTEDHLDRHLTMENYIAAKERIFENHSKNDTTVLNYDNEITRAMRPPGRVVWFSTLEIPNGDCIFIQDGIITARLHGTETQILPVSQTRVMAENALAATALALLAGASATDIAEVLMNFAGIAHRMEYLGKINGKDYYNDSKATNIDSAIKGLGMFDTPVTLIAGGYDKGGDFAPWVAFFPKKVEKLILIGNTATRIAQACDAINFTKYEIAPTLQAAIEQASGATTAVVFSPACASFDMFRDFEHRGEMFKELVNAQTQTTKTE
jgi:UDP-N-acetylmuramoylalanine--D-glutamate ligase